MLHYFYMTAAANFPGFPVMRGKAEEFTRCLQIRGRDVLDGTGVHHRTLCVPVTAERSERVTKVAMIAPLAIMVYHQQLLHDGAKEYLQFYLVPDFDVCRRSVVSTLVGAMNQAFFTLSLGIVLWRSLKLHIGK